MKCSRKCAEYNQILFNIFVYFSCVPHVFRNILSIVSLEGVTRFSSPSPQKFVGFFLTVERNNDEKTPFSHYEEDDLGSFTILYPALSKISEKCPNVVVNTNSVPKSDVLVRLTSLLIYVSSTV